MIVKNDIRVRLEIEFKTMKRKLSKFLNDHWILKWFVLPIWFMATILLILFLLFARATTIEAIQVVGLFIGISLAIIGIGLGIEYCIYKVTGTEFFQQREEYE